MDIHEERIQQLEKEISAYREREIKYEERINRLKVQIDRLQKEQETKKVSQSKGRPGLSLAKKQAIWNMRQEGRTVREVAAHYQVSVGTVSNIIREYKEKESFPQRVILYFMNRDEICTKIYVDFGVEKIRIENVTEDILYRAFGCRENPTWEDFQQFLEDRCFPRTRDKMKIILKDLGLQSYDPWQIVQKTQGRMAEDYQWIQIVREEDDKIK